MTTEEIRDFSSLNPHKVAAKKMHHEYFQNLSWTTGKSYWCNTVPYYERLEVA